MKQFVLSCFLIFYSYFVGAQKLLPPETGAYWGAYVDSGAPFERVDFESVREFEKTTGKRLVWSYFFNNWFSGIIEFPWESVADCDRLGTIPYIRMMAWNEMRTSGPDPYYKMIDFALGVFDEPLRKWAIAAKSYGKPLILEFGPEVNGNWFSWNGRWNGGGIKNKYGSSTYPDGPEVFRDAYRRIIEIFRRESVSNVTWVFHVDVSTVPDTWWNHPEYYYPGDDYIDWVGLSLFGAQLPSHKWSRFSDRLWYFLPELERISRVKPVMISEFAVIEDSEDPDRKALWLKEALEELRSDPEFTRIKGISYWNSPGWLTDNSADFRISSSIGAKKSFKKALSDSYWIPGPLNLQKKVEK